MIKCSKCDHSFSSELDSFKTIVAKDVYMQVSEYLHRCPNCGHTEKEQVLEESTLKKSAV